MTKSRPTLALDHRHHAIGFCVALAAALLLPFGSEAQDRVDARTVAARVQAFYDQSQTYQATFHQTYYNRLHGRYERSTGRISLLKPGRMRFDYAAPNGKVIVSDGRKLTMWEPGDNGGPGQYAQSTMGEASISSAFSFLTGQGRLEDNYRFRLLSGARYGFSGDVLEMTPKAVDPTFRRVLLFVDNSPGRAGVVHHVRVDDHEGNRNKFSFTGMRFNRNIGEDLFAFAPPRGARRI